MNKHVCEVSGIEFETNKSTLWEMIDDNDICPTQRLKVPGGWLYRIKFESGVSMCFVPESDRCIHHKDEYLYRVCDSCLRKEKADFLERTDLP